MFKMIKKTFTEEELIQAVAFRVTTDKKFEAKLKKAISKTKKLSDEELNSAVGGFDFARLGLAFATGGSSEVGYAIKDGAGL
jgi:hypothetical protein